MSGGAVRLGQQSRMTGPRGAREFGRGAEADCTNGSRQTRPEEQAEGNRGAGTGPEQN